MKESNDGLEVLVKEGSNETMKAITELKEIVEENTKRVQANIDITKQSIDMMLTIKG